jgi:hypothetical protein
LSLPISCPREGGVTFFSKRRVWRTECPIEITLAIPRWLEYRKSCTDKWKNQHKTTIPAKRLGVSSSCGQAYSIFSSPSTEETNTCYVKGYNQYLETRSILLQIQELRSASSIILQFSIYHCVGIPCQKNMVVPLTSKAICNSCLSFQSVQCCPLDYGRQFIQAFVPGLD